MHSPAIENRSIAQGLSRADAAPATFERRKERRRPELSKLEKDLLAVLEPYPMHDACSLLRGEAPRVLARTRDLITAIGRSQSPWSYAAVTQGLAGLEAQGLVEKWNGGARKRDARRGYALPGRYQPLSMDERQSVATRPGGTWGRWIWASRRRPRAVLAGASRLL